MSSEPVGDPESAEWWAELDERVARDGPRYSRRNGICPICRRGGSLAVPLQGIPWFRPEIGSLMQKYEVKPVREYEGGKNYNGDDALQIIWKQALEKLRLANDLLSEKSKA